MIRTMDAYVDELQLCIWSTANQVLGIKSKGTMIKL